MKTEFMIDDNFSLKHDNVCWHLVRRFEKVRKHDDAKGRWKKGDRYVSEDTSYYPTIKMALKNYLNDSLSEAQTILEVIDKIDEVESKIDNLNIVIK